LRERATTDRLAAGHECGTRWRALRLHGVVGEANALTGELVDPRGRRAATVDREVTPTDIVDQDKHDVGLLGSGLLSMSVSGQQE